MIVRQEYYLGTALLVQILCSLFYNIECLFCVLLLYADFLDVLGVEFCATVKYRQLGSVYFKYGVVDAVSEECRHCVFDGADSDISFLYDCAAVCAIDILGQRRYFWRSLKVDSFYFYTVVFWCWANFQCDVHASV